MRIDTPARRPLTAGPGLYVGALLLLVDACLVTVHILGAGSGQPEDWLWWLDADGGHPELLQYVKLLWVALLLAIAAWRWRRLAWLAATLAALAVLVDDVWMLHERFGPVVGQMVPLPPNSGDYADFVGELLVLAAAGSVLLLLMVVGYLRADAHTRAWLRPIIILFVALAFVGGVVDLLHQTTQALAYRVGTVVEDGGEMVVASLMAAQAFHVATHATGRGGARPTFRAGPGGLLLILLLAVDALLIANHVNANVVGEAPEWSGWVDVDGGGPEFMQYVKFVWGAVLVGVVWWRTRRAVWLLAAAPFVVMLLDDALTLHEQLGEPVAALLPLPEAWLDYGQFLGEFALLTVVGGVLLIVILGGYLLTRDAATRRRLRPLVPLLVLMAVFAGVVDLVHQWTQDLLYEVLTLVEDGGEMLTASALVAWAFHLATRNPHAEPEKAANLPSVDAVR